MKFFSPIRFSFLACGLITASVMVTSCNTNVSPIKASERLASSPRISVFSHNSKHYAENRDCYEIGELPPRARRALITWLHDSEVVEMSYVYPQYYITSYNERGGGEVVWGILSDGKGNMVGVMVPDSKRVPAWDLPTVGAYKVYVCKTDEKKALGDAIMETLADAHFDDRRLDSLRAMGLVDKQYLLSKPEPQQVPKAATDTGKSQDKSAADDKKTQDTKKDKTSDDDTSSDDDDTTPIPDEEDSSTDDSDDTSDSGSDDSGTGDGDDLGGDDTSSDEE